MANKAIPEKRYYKIGEVSELTGVKPYVLRYWQSEFKLVSPAKSQSNQRLYRKKDIEVILSIKKLLYEERFTIAGAKRQLRAVLGRGRPVEEKDEPKPRPQLDFGFDDKNLRAVLEKVSEELQAIRELTR